MARQNVPVLKLLYLDHPFWRAECVRLCLHLGKVPFQDARMDWDGLESSGKLTFGTFPVLEVDGKVLSQTQAIASYCGKLSGHYPSDPWLAAKVDEFLNGLTDVTELITATMQERNPQRKVQWRQALVAPNGRMTQFLRGLERLLFENGSNGFCVGNSLTVADLAAWRAVGWIGSGVLDGIPVDYISSTFPRLAAVYQNVDSMPAVAEWKALHPRNYKV